MLGQVGSALGVEDEGDGRVVVQVLPDAGEVVDDVDADVAQVRGRPDAGEHQQLRAS